MICVLFFCVFVDVGWWNLFNLLCCNIVGKVFLFTMSFTCVVWILDVFLLTNKVFLLILFYCTFPNDVVGRIYTKRLYKKLCYIFDDFSLAIEMFICLRRLLWLIVLLFLYDVTLERCLSLTYFLLWNKGSTSFNLRMYNLYQNPK